MANYKKGFEKFSVQADPLKVSELHAFAPKCGQPTGNVLGYELMLAGLAMLQDPTSPPRIPQSILAMRSKLYGEEMPDPIEAERKTLQQSLLAPDFLGQLLEKLRAYEAEKEATERAEADAKKKQARHRDAA